jgi:hypothetical protein
MLPDIAPSAFQIDRKPIKDAVGEAQKILPAADLSLVILKGPSIHGVHLQTKGRVMFFRQTRAVTRRRLRHTGRQKHHG